VLTTFSVRASVIASVRATLRSPSRRVTRAHQDPGRRGLGRPAQSFARGHGVTRRLFEQHRHARRDGSDGMGDMKLIGSGQHHAIRPALVEQLVELPT
jgi:hypothetical protein